MITRGPLPILTHILFPRVLKQVAIMLLVTLIVVTLILVLTPWRQFSQGFGQVIALDTNNRVQKLIVPVDGAISKWHVIDGQFVEKNQKIVEIADNDPNIIQRLSEEKAALSKQLIAAIDAADLARRNYLRQESLWNQGLTAQKEYEKSQIVYRDKEMKVTTVQTKLAQINIKLGRQSAQVIRAVQDGYITDIDYFANASFVKAGTVIGQFVPVVTDPAVMLFVDGIDVPLIHAGRKVRIRFEGWPVFQFSGFPNAAIGTFGGVVKFMANAPSRNGKFKVIIVPDPDDTPWPTQDYMKYGMQAEGWILLSEVKLGYEIWRKLNGFPPKLDKP